MAEYLTKNGYPAANEDGVVRIQMALTKKDVKNVVAMMKELQYESSYGFRRKQEQSKERRENEGTEIGFH